MIRVEGDTAYVTTVEEAFQVSSLGEPTVLYVVVEDPAERIKMQKIEKAFTRAFGALPGDDNDQ